MEKKTNLEMLVWGLNHIAENHGIKFVVDLCVYGGCYVPILADVQMLCEELGIDADCISSFGTGADIEVTDDWLESKAKEEYVGLGFWKRTTDGDNPFMK